MVPTPSTSNVGPREGVSYPRSYSAHLFSPSGFWEIPDTEASQIPCGLTAAARDQTTQPPRALREIEESRAPRGLFAARTVLPDLHEHGLLLPCDAGEAAKSAQSPLAA